jgi:hypothetical protein
LSAASFDHGVDDGAALTSVSFANEQPVFLADGRGTNGIFHPVMPRRILCRVAEKNFDISSTGH